ncbi:MAG: hypothetical protein QG611_213 [Bacteroidota bacterium]|nr:hypothetical protein [Bacteroidota bacterium]
MRKKFKYTTVISMWLAGISLIGHMVIPHDHHLADTNFNQEKNCPSTGNESDHSSGYPIHCSAFNDLASEEQRSYQFSRIIQHNLFPVHNSANTLIFKFQDPITKIPDLPIPIFDTFTLGSSPLRAPPSIV